MIIGNYPCVFLKIEPEKCAPPPPHPQQTITEKLRLYGFGNDGLRGQFLVDIMVAFPLAIEGLSNFCSRASCFSSVQWSFKYEYIRFSYLFRSVKSLCLKTVISTLDTKMLASNFKNTWIFKPGKIYVSDCCSVLIPLNNTGTL